MADPHPPPGYRPIDMQDHFTDASGPFYSRVDQGRPLLGILIAEKHVSARGVCHGGVLTCMADLQSIQGAYLAGIRDRLNPTVNLTVDFLAPARLGDWIEMRVDLLKATGQFLFTQALLCTSAGVAIARSSGIYKVSPVPHPVPGMVERLFD